MKSIKYYLLLIGGLGFSLCGYDAKCQTPTAAADSLKPASAYLSQPLIRSIFTADPSARVFNGHIYIYCSHDVDTDKGGDKGAHYDMKDYHILSLPAIDGLAKDNGVSLSISEVPWAHRQMWAPDAAEKNGRYYLYFPAKDSSGVFRIGVAIGDSPTGKFKAQPKPIANSFSIDPCVFKDTDGSFYMYFGGLWGGQLQSWSSGQFDKARDQKDVGKDDAPALAPKVARLNGNMLEFSDKPKDIVILDQTGNPLVNKDHDRRFFEAAWMFKRNGRYYFTYSTGDTHYLCYATGTSPYGPFTYQGVILKPVQGWTTHQSIVNYQNKWYLFYHDTQLSGKNWLRNIKVTELHFANDGNIITIDPMRH